MTRRTLGLVCLGLAGTLAVSGDAVAKKADPTKMTCEEYLQRSEGERTAAAAFVDGWSKGKKKAELDEVTVDRDVTTLVAKCTEKPKESLWRRFEEHLPVVKNHLKPIKMTCTDYLALDSKVQPELFYYLDGYDRATRTQEDVAGEVDLEQDYAAFVEVCKQAPKESVWQKLKARFEKKQ